MWSAFQVEPTVCQASFRIQLTLDSSGIFLPLKSKPFFNFHINATDKFDRNATNKASKCTFKSRLWTASASSLVVADCSSLPGRKKAMIQTVLKKSSY